MLREARTFMNLIGAHFLVTGEVVGQRPMSQQKNTLRMIEKEAGVKGLVLRPLSARNLTPTVPEQNGWVDREKLYGFNGRSRKPQMALAREFGLTEYPNPAGGCLLTDPLYSARLRRLLEVRADIDYGDIQLLRAGRQFWTPSGGWIIVGRDEADNLALEKLLRPEDFLLFVPGVGSPTALVRFSQSDEDLRLAGSICARYTKLMKSDSVRVESDEGRGYEVKPLTSEEVDRIRL